VDFQVTRECSTGDVCAQSQENDECRCDEDERDLARLPELNLKDAEEIRKLPGGSNNPEPYTGFSLIQCEYRVLLKKFENTLN
jgi:hypothetical protein